MKRVEEVSSQATLPLRMKVLRPDVTSCEERHFGGEMPASARHFACIEGDQIVGVGYIVPNSAPFAPEAKGWQLRGMAVEPDRQGQGIGAGIVRHVEALARREGVEMLWFNARRVAVGFYEKLGYEVHSDEFDIPAVGPHFVMGKRL